MKRTPRQRYELRQARRWLRFLLLWRDIGEEMLRRRAAEERRAHHARIREVIEGFRRMRDVAPAPPAGRRQRVSRVVFKYPIPMKDRFDLALPTGAQVLTVQTQRGEPHLWALVHPGLPPETRSFHLYGTGHPVDHAPLRYVGTFQLEDGRLVFHVFEGRSEGDSQ